MKAKYKAIAAKWNTLAAEIEEAGREELLGGSAAARICVARAR